MTSNQSPQAIVDVAESKIEDSKSKQSSIVVWCALKWRAILAEFVATLMLVFFGCMSCIPIDGLVQQSPFYAPFGFGLTVMINIQIFGHLSGAHMNPAVTLAGVIWGNTSIALGVAYFVVQCAGAIVGYGLLIGLAPNNVAEYGYCVLTPHPGLSEFQVLGIEVLLTATLVLITYALWDPVHQNNQETSPIKFGLTITGLSIVGGPLTGTGMNPARALGPVVWSGMWYIHWVYWIGPFIGSIFGATLYKIIWLKKDKSV